MGVIEEQVLRQSVSSLLVARLLTNSRLTDEQQLADKRPTYIHVQTANCQPKCTNGQQSNGWWSPGELLVESLPTDG